MILILILIVYLRRTGSSRMPTWFGEYGSCQPLSPYCPPTAPYCPHATDRPTDQPRRVFFSLPPPPLLSTRAFFLFLGGHCAHRDNRCGITCNVLAGSRLQAPDVAVPDHRGPRQRPDHADLALRGPRRTATSTLFFWFLLVGFWGSISHAFLTHFRHPIRAGSYSVSMCWVLIGVVLAI